MNAPARVAALSLLAGSAAALAESGWLTARGRLAPELRVEAWGGPRSVGAGFLRPDEPGAPAGLGAEVAYVIPDRVLTLRAGRAWQLTRTGFATASATLGGAAWFVPQVDFDLGIGPHAGLALALGGERFTVDLGLQAGLEIFVRYGGPRVPVRAQLGASLRLGEWAVGAMARAGADVLPGEGFVGRGEVILSLSWFGLERVTRPAD